MRLLQQLNNLFTNFGNPSNMNKNSRNQQKLLKIITHKLKDGEFILTIEYIWFIPHRKLPVKELLVITTNSLYFYDQGTLRKYLKVGCIHKIIMTPFSTEIILNYNQQKEGNTAANNQKQNQSFYRISSEANVRIIKNILEVHEKFLGVQNKMKKQFHISLVRQKTLGDYTQKTEASEKNRYKFFKYFFPSSNKNQNDHKNMQSSLAQASFPVTLKNFSLLIGQKMYEQIYKNINLLYINSQKSFLFLQDSYNCIILNENTKIFSLKQNQQAVRQAKSYPQSTKSIKTQPCLTFPHPSITNIENQSKMMVRTIPKRSQQYNAKIGQRLKNYQNKQYKEEIRYAIETQTHFEVFSPLLSDEQSLSEILERTECQNFCEKDLRSVFFKIIEMIESESHTIFCSLSLQNIRSSREGGIKISEIFSSLPARVQLEYIAPQELINWKLDEQSQKHEFSSVQIQLINLWKAGILIFEMAYGNVPFPIQIVVYNYLQNQSELPINFPQQIFRTFQFKNFINTILQINPKLRGGPQSEVNWKEKVLQLDWMRLK